MRDEGSEVLELLAAHERVIGRLYESCAEAFPKHRDLWLGLAVDEARHAERLEGLGSEAVRSAWRSRGRQLKPEAIRLSIGFVEKLKARVEGRAITVREALIAARDLENALLEKQFANLDEGLPAEVRSVLQHLAVETERHRALTAAALQAEMG